MQYWDSGRLKRAIIRKVYGDKAAFERSMPAEYRRLNELIEDPQPCVRLRSGSSYCFRADELKKLLINTPWFLHSFIKLPWVFNYRRLGYVAVYRLVGPDRWAARTLNLLLEGDLGGEKWEVRPGEFYRLLRDYKSLIIVVLSVDL